MNELNCPISNKIIDDFVCFSISMVAEGMSPERFAGDAVKVDGYKTICLNCPNHRTD